MNEVKHRMKRASLERLIEWLKDQDDEHWNMGDTLGVRDDTETWDLMEHGEELERIPLCHTAGCLAGHCILLQNVDEQRMIPMEVIGNSIINKAADFLGIERSDDYLTLKEFLFTPALTYGDVTRLIAIDVLEHIRDHGVLYWGKFVKSRYGIVGSGANSPLPIELY